MLIFCRQVYSLLLPFLGYLSLHTLFFFFLMSFIHIEITLLLTGKLGNIAPSILQAQSENV